MIYLDKSVKDIHRNSIMRGGVSSFEFDADQCLKNQRFSPSGSKYKGFRIFDFVAKQM